MSREPSRRPRILFLADRNILANQAYNAFSAFPEDAMVRIAPEDIKKKGKVPKNGSLFFTIFQTFMASAGSATGASTGAGIPEVSDIRKRQWLHVYLGMCGRESLYRKHDKFARTAGSAQKRRRSRAYEEEFAGQITLLRNL